MKTIHYKMYVTDGISHWSEEHTEHVEDTISAFDHAKGMIDFFNSTRFPSERERKLILVRTRLKGEGRLKHTWKKKSIVTEKGGYDIYTCINCGATGKRYGLSNSIIPDKKYNQFCKTK